MNRSQETLLYRSHRHDRSCLAFSLVELLVTIGIVALLLAIAAPVLASARDRARTLKSQANLRSIAQLVELYVNDAGGSYLQPEPGRLYPGPTPEVQTTVAHWGVPGEWQYVLGEIAKPWEQADVYTSPGAVRDTQPGVIVSVPTSYFYAASFLARPALWTDRPVTDFASLRRAATRAEVRFPASKALMWDWEMGFLRRERRTAGEYGTDIAERTPMLFADTHVDLGVPAEAAEPVFNRDPEAQDPVERLHNTPEGVHGRDY